MGERGFAGIQRAWWTLLWFWIPAHAVTFCLPTEYQIGLAAIWGMVLGLILGLSRGRAGTGAVRGQGVFAKHG